ncbi:MAG: SulP family inorganic anion transporter [Chitinophagales bacterium]
MIASIHFFLLFSSDKPKTNTNLSTPKTPYTGFKGLRHHWKDDIKAAFSVALVALPLGLGLAEASGAPPISGVISAIVAGLFVTFFRSSKIAINGPANGLIVVIASAMVALGQFQYVLATVVIAGVFISAIGLLKLGRFGNMFPTSAVQGLLAAIGIIILAKEINVALGVKISTSSGIDAIKAIPHSIQNMHPLVALIGLVSVIVMVVYPKIKSKIIHLLPGPLWVLIVAIPLGLLFNYLHEINVITNEALKISDNFKVSIPPNFVEGFMFPDFSKYKLLPFWEAVFLITLLGTIESIISTKAVDKLDPYNRKTDLNRDLFAVGLGTSVSGLIGGLPVITVIARSTVNVQQHAKTKWSNFFHGAILLLLIWLIPDIINMIPRSALSAILIIAGFKLTSPTVYKRALSKGWEQLIIVLATLLATLYYGLLQGVVVGIVATLLIHIVKSRLQVGTFFKHLRRPDISIYKEPNNIYHVDLKGIINFTVIPKLTKELAALPEGHHVVADFGKAKIVDSSVLNFIYEFQEKYDHDGGNFELVGLSTHRVSSPHPQALHVIEKPMLGRFTPRQSSLSKFAKANEYEFRPAVSWDTHYMDEFHYFEHKWIEHKANAVSGNYENGQKWEICDITYNESVLVASDLHKVTAMFIELDKPFEPFVLSKEMKWKLKEKWDKTSSKPSWRKWINNFMENSEQEEFPECLLNDNFVKLILDNESHQIECCGKKILVIRKRSRVSGILEFENLYNFSKALITELKQCK